MNNRNEEKMNGKHVIIANDDSVNNLDKEPDDVLFTKASEVVDYIQEQYRIYGCESDLSSMYFENVYVSDMSKRDIPDRRWHPSAARTEDPLRER